MTESLGYTPETNTILYINCTSIKFLKKKEIRDFPGGSDGKESACNEGNSGLTPRLRSKGIPEREWQPTPVFLPGESHGQRSLGGCSPWGHKELDTTERLPFHVSLSCIGEVNGNPFQYS